MRLRGGKQESETQEHLATQIRRFFPRIGGIAALGKRMYNHPTDVTLKWVARRDRERRELPESPPRGRHPSIAREFGPYVHACFSKSDRQSTLERHPESLGGSVRVRRRTEMHVPEKADGNQRPLQPPRHERDYWTRIINGIPTIVCGVTPTEQQRSSTPPASK